MQWSDIYVRSGAAVLGRPIDTAAAVADGRYHELLSKSHDYQSIAHADGRTPVEMAVEAAESAVSRSAVPAADFRMVVHTSSTVSDSGMVTASYIQGRTVQGTACTLEVRQSCSAAIAELEIASAYLTASPASSAALLTTVDVTPDDIRFSEDPGSISGDSATALVLSRGSGIARLLSTAIVSDGRFADIGSGPPPEGGPRAQRLRLLAILDSMLALERQSVALALDDAGLDSGDISRWVFPNVGANTVDRDFRASLGADDARTTWSWGRTVGHLGTGNQFGGLTHLLETGAVEVGDRVALCGSGAGFSIGCAILEIVDLPAWTGA